MIRLAKYVENELYENSILFAEAEARLMASCSYIDFILKDKALSKLNSEEKNILIKCAKVIKNFKSFPKK